MLADTKLMYEDITWNLLYVIYIDFSRSLSGYIIFFLRRLMDYIPV